MGRIRAALVTLWTPKIEGWCKRFSDEKAAYCRRWDLGYHAYGDRIDESREPTWSKVPALRRHLADYDWLFWIDADAAITNPHLDVRDLCDDHFDLIVTHDHSGFNAGIFLIRNSAIGAEFLARVWDRNIADYHFEQSAMIQIMAEMPEIKVKVVPRRTMNSYWFDHRPGDFIIHAAGESNDAKGKLLTVFSNAARDNPVATSTEWPTGKKRAQEAAVRFTTGYEELVKGKSRGKAVITVCTIWKNAKYLELANLWLEGVRRSGWDGDVLIFTNRIEELSALESVTSHGAEVRRMGAPGAYGDLFRQKTVAARLALLDYEEILFTDLDVAIVRDPSEWAFSHDRMMVSEDVFSLFHPCMLRAWYPSAPDQGEPGLNAGIWSVHREHAEASLARWHEDMSFRLDADLWPVAPTLNDQSILNKLWYEGAVDLGLFPKDKVGYPSTPVWPGNHNSPWAVHCCGVGSAADEMRKILHLPGDRSKPRAPEKKQRSIADTGRLLCPPWERADWLALLSFAEVFQIPEAMLPEELSALVARYQARISFEEDPEVPLIVSGLSLKRLPSDPGAFLPLVSHDSIVAVRHPFWVAREYPACLIVGAAWQGFFPDAMDWLAPVCSESGWRDLVKAFPGEVVWREWCDLPFIPGGFSAAAETDDPGAVEWWTEATRAAAGHEADLESSFVRLMAREVACGRDLSVVTVVDPETAGDFLNSWKTWKMPETVRIEIGCLDLDLTEFREALGSGGEGLPANLGLHDLATGGLDAYESDPCAWTIAVGHRLSRTGRWVWLDPDCFQASSEVEAGLFPGEEWDSCVAAFAGHYLRNSAPRPGDGGGRGEWPVLENAYWIGSPMMMMGKDVSENLLSAWSEKAGTPMDEYLPKWLSRHGIPASVFNFKKMGWSK